MIHYLRNFRLLLTALAVSVATVASADVTIKVQKGGTAPYLYAYTGAMGSGTPCAGFTWPGTQFTDQDDDGYWTMTIAGVSTVNIIFTDGATSNTNQTNDILNVTGVDGVARFMYNGKSTWFSVMPPLNTANEGYIYFNCPPDWGNTSSYAPFIHFLNSSGGQLGSTGWPGYQMEYVGVDGAGFSIYRYYTANWSGISAMIFNNGSASGSNQQTANLTYVANGYYNTTGSQALVHRLSSANGYTDANFRAGVASQMGISDGDVFAPTTVLYLDVSGKNVSSVAGISNFTNLQTLIAANNNISQADLSTINTLEVLDLSSNSASLLGPSSTNGTGHITFANNAPLTYLDLSNNSGLSSFSPIYSTYHINTLQTLKLANVPLGWSSAIASQTGLTYLDLSNSSIASTETANLSALTKLEYLDLSDNANLTVAHLSLPASLPELKTLKLNNCDKLSTGTSNYVSLAACTVLETLEFSDVDLYINQVVASIPASAKATLKTIKFSNDRLGSPDPLTGFTALTTLDLSGNNSMTALTIDACTALQSVNLTGDTGLATLTLSNDGLTSLGAFTGLDACTALTTLDLTGNQFTAIPDVSSTTVSALNMSNNAISGSVAHTATALRSLNLSGNSGITALDLSGNALTELTLTGLTALTTLDLTDNSTLTASGLTLPATLPSLTTLVLDNCDALSASATNHISLAPFTALKTLDFSNVDFYTTAIVGTIPSSAKATLQNINLSNDQLGTPSLSGFTALKTIDVSGNSGMATFTLTGCDALETVDVTGDTGLTALTLTGDGLTASATLTGLSTCTALATLDLSDNAYTAVPALALPASCATLLMNDNSLASIVMPGGSPVQFLYAENNALAGDITLDADNLGTLKGLDLNANAMTGFTAENTALTALMIGETTTLTEVNLHGNDGLTVTTAATTMTDGSGLYVKNNSVLTTIDISNSSFTGIGQDGSLAGLSSVTRLDGSHNAFTLFANGSYIAHTPSYTYYDATVGGNVTTSMPAVAAHANMPNLDALTGLEWLDMSYNRIDSIHLYKQTALKHLDLSHNGYDRGTDTRTTNPNPQQVYRSGLQKLDAHNLTALEYLDVSHCRIQETAIDRMSETSVIDGTNYSGGYVWIKHCQALKEFYADHNGMRSFGLGDNPNLERASAMYMYGQSPETMKSAIDIHGFAVNGGYSKLKYFNVSYSMFDSIGVSLGRDLEELHVEGNPIHYLDLNACSKLQQVYAGDCTLDKRGGSTTVLDASISTPLSGLRQVKAQALTDLTLLDVSGDTELLNLYCNDNTSLPQVTGLDECAALQVLHAYNDELLGENGFNVATNTALRELWVWNCGLDGTFAVSQCPDMASLRCNDNDITTLDISSLQGITWLDCYNNTGLATLVPGASTAMLHLDLHNCAVVDLDVAANTALAYFDCDNNHIRELDLSGAAAIETVKANSNNLFQINLGGNHAGLTTLQFADNHINAIDLSGCTSLAQSAISSENNGRTIRANCNVVGGNYVYFFQLQDVTAASGGNLYMPEMGCAEDAIGYGRGATVTAGIAAKSLAGDGLVVDNITWGTAPVVGNRHAGRHGALDPNKVFGTIVELSPASTSGGVASGQEVYAYDNGNGTTSSFYLNWTADNSIITGIDDVTTDGGPTVTGGDGCLVVTSTADTVLTVYDLAGRTVLSRQVAAGSTTIDGLEPGTYLVRGHKVVIK